MTMCVVHKHELEPLSVTTIHAPADVQFLHVAAQNGKVMLWVSLSVEPGVVNVPHHISVIGTGQHHREHLRYLGTAQIDWCVWHAFLWTNPPA